MLVFELVLTGCAFGRKFAAAAPSDNYTSLQCTTSRGYTVFLRCLSLHVGTCQVELTHVVTIFYLPVQVSLALCGRRLLPPLHPCPYV